MRSGLINCLPPSHFPNFLMHNWFWKSKRICWHGLTNILWGIHPFHYPSWPSFASSVLSPTTSNSSINDLLWAFFALLLIKEGPTVTLCYYVICTDFVTVVSFAETPMTPYKSTRVKFGVIVATYMCCSCVVVFCPMSDVLEGCQPTLKFVENSRWKWRWNENTDLFNQSRYV